MWPYLQLGIVSIPMYSLCIFLGLGFGILLAVRRCRVYQISKEDVFYCILYGCIGLLIGGKLLYLLTILPQLVQLPKEFFQDFANIEPLLLGGFVFYGGLFGAIGGVLIYCKQYHLTVIPMLEVICLVVPLIHAFGRLGCFFAGCCYGMPAPEPWGVIFHHSEIAPNDIPLLPVQLLEAAGNLLIFLGLWFGFRKKKTDGQILGLYCVCYGVLRFGMEFLRADSYRGILGIFSLSQWLSLAMVLFGGIWLYWRRQKQRKRVNPESFG